MVWREHCVARAISYSKRFGHLVCAVDVYRKMSGEEHIEWYIHGWGGQNQKSGSLEDAKAAVKQEAKNIAMSILDALEQE